MTQHLGRMYEYLLHTPHPKSPGSTLCSRGSIEVTSVIPPAQTISFEVLPLDNTYARLEYYLGFCPTMVPNTITWGCSCHGVNNLASRINPLFIRESFPCECVIFENSPCCAWAANISALNQYFSFVAEYLVVENEDDYKLIIDALEKLTMSNLEGLASDAVNLLRKMQIQPLPPIGSR